MMRLIGRCFVGMLLAATAAFGGGCGGFTIVLPDVPDECFQEDVVAEDCFTDEYFIEVCEEDFFGDVFCYDELVVDVICEDVVIDSYIVCE